MYSSIASLFLSFCSSFTIEIDACTRSLTILSTSRPTKPTSVYLLASTLTKGYPIILARRLAISVFPTPVEPIMRIFFGIISSCISCGSCIRLYLLRSAIATVFLASFCPMMYSSRYFTISFGVNCISFFIYPL